jgi:hypothetical protein
MAVLLLLTYGCDDASVNRQETTRTIDASGPSSCDDEESVFVRALTQVGSCVADADCVVYTAHCVQSRSDNCAGFFYVDGAHVAELEMLRADLESCRNVPCNPGPTCGLGSLSPKCISGECVGRQSL